MTSEPQNPFFRPPLEATLGDDDARSHIRSEFYEIRSRFLDRLACANVFDRERFEALLLWFDILQKSCAAADLPMADSDFDQFSDIAGHLEQQATYSRDQRAEFTAAHVRWLGIMRQFHLLPEERP